LAAPLFLSKLVRYLLELGAVGPIQSTRSNYPSSSIELWEPLIKGQRKRQSIGAAEQEKDKATELAQPQSNAKNPTMLRKEL
jgi:hypothetical protein